MRVYAWPSDSGACKFYRSTLPTAALNRLDGWEAATTPDGVTRLPDEVLTDPDWLVVLQRSYNPSAQATMRRLSRQGRPWVFDVDDNLWELEPENPAYRTYANPVVRDTLTWMVRNATVVTVSTEPLAERVRELTDRPVEVIPNALPLSMIDPADTPTEPTILWRGSPTHDLDVDLVGYALRKAERAGVRVVFAGQDYRERLRLKHATTLDELVLSDPRLIDALGGRRRVRLVPSERDRNRPRRSVWLSPTEYLEAVAALVKPTVAVCPLRDTVFSRCKSHIAALEAHAVGAVPVASHTASFDWYLTDGVDGLLVRNAEPEWHKAVQRVLSLSDSERAAMVAAGRDRACATSVDSLTARYAEVYEKAAAG